jgi:hypothetical protein
MGSYFFFFFFFEMLRIEAIASGVLGKCSTTELHPQSWSPALMQTIPVFHSAHYTCCVVYLGFSRMELLPVHFFRVSGLFV